MWFFQMHDGIWDRRKIRHELMPTNGTANKQTEKKYSSVIWEWAKFVLYFIWLCTKKTHRNLKIVVHQREFHAPVTHKHHKHRICTKALYKCTWGLSFLFIRSLSACISAQWKIFKELGPLSACASSAKSTKTICSAKSLNNWNGNDHFNNASKLFSPKHFFFGFQTIHKPFFSCLSTSRSRACVNRDVN